MREEAGSPASAPVPSPLAKRDCRQAPGTPPAPTSRDPLTYAVGFQCISFSWRRGDWGDYYKIEASYDGSPVFAPVAGAEALRGASHQLPVRYWDINWGRTAFRLRACSHLRRPIAVRCRTVSSVTLAPADAAEAAFPVKMPLAGLLDRPGADIEWSGQHEGAQLLMRSQNTSWESHTSRTEYPRYPDKAYSTIALSADRKTLARLVVPERLAKHIILYSAGPQGWRPDLAVPLQDSKSEIRGIGDARQLPLLPPSPRSALREERSIHEISLSADGGTFAAILRHAPAIPHHNTSVAKTVFSGAVVIFHKDRGGWRHQGLLQPRSLGDGAGFGTGFAMSADGNTVFAGAPGEGALAGDEGGGEAVLEAGAVYQFVRRGGSWRRRARLAARVPRPLERLGQAIALSADGRTLAVGTQSRKAAQVHTLARAHLAPGETMPDEPVPTGAVHIFRLAGGKWVHSDVVRPDAPDADGAFGEAVSLSADGSALAVGAPSKYLDGKPRETIMVAPGTMLPREDLGTAQGLDSMAFDERRDLAPGGAAYVFGLENGRWRQKTLIDFPSHRLKLFGSRVSLDSIGRTLYVSAVERGAWNLELLYGHGSSESAAYANKEMPAVLYYIY